jgi:hypothetical protein
MKVYVLNEIENKEDYSSILLEALADSLAGNFDRVEDKFATLLKEVDMSIVLSDLFGVCGDNAFVQYALLCPRAYKSISKFVEKYDLDIEDTLPSETVKFLIKRFPAYEIEKVTTIAKFIDLFDFFSTGDIVNMLSKVIGSWVKDFLFKNNGDFTRITSQELNTIVNKQYKKDSLPKYVDEVARFALYLGLIIFVLDETSDTFDRDCVVFNKGEDNTANAIIVKMISMFSMDWYLQGIMEGDSTPKYFKIPKGFNLSNDASLGGKDYNGMSKDRDIPKYMALMTADLLKGRLDPYPANCFYQFNDSELNLLNRDFENLWNAFFNEKDMKTHQSFNEEDFYYFAKMMLVYTLPLINDLNNSREFFYTKDGERNGMAKQLADKIKVVNNELEVAKTNIDRYEKSLQEKDKALAQFENTKLSLSEANEENARLLERIKVLEDELESDRKPAIVAKEFKETNGYNRLYNYLNSSDVSIIGGWGNWIKKIKTHLPNAKYYEAERVNKSLDGIKNDKLVIFNSSANNHGMYYQVKNILKDTNIPMIYIPTQSSNFEMVMYNLKNELDKNGIEY